MAIFENLLVPSGLSYILDDLENGCVKSVFKIGLENWQILFGFEPKTLQTKYTYKSPVKCGWKSKSNPFQTNETK